MSRVGDRPASSSSVTTRVGSVSIRKTGRSRFAASNAWMAGMTLRAAVEGGQRMVVSLTVGDGQVLVADQAREPRDPSPVRGTARPSLSHRPVRPGLAGRRARRPAPEAGLAHGHRVTRQDDGRGQWRQFLPGCRDDGHVVNHGRDQPDHARWSIRSPPKGSHALGRPIRLLSPPQRMTAPRLMAPPPDRGSRRST